MKLGAVYTESVNALYRMVMPMTAMERLGHVVVECKQQRGKRLAIRELAECDLVHIHRLRLVDDDDDCVALLREAGCAVSFDEDDDMGAGTPEIEAIVGKENYETGQRDFAQRLARVPDVDLVTTPSAALADRFERAGAARVEVIDNYLIDDFVGTSAKGHEGLVIGWHACREHLIDADRLAIADALARILDAHPHVHVRTIGIDLGIDHERYHAQGSVPFNTLTQHIADFDIGIAPLADLPFGRARSNIKAREYAAAGVPWLASPVGPYRALGKSEGGRLVHDGDWHDALDRIIRSPIERGLQRRKARSWGRRETIASMAHLWEEAFLETVDEIRAAA
jgi:hypothetical protein